MRNPNYSYLLECRYNGWHSSCQLESQGNLGSENQTQRATRQCSNKIKKAWKPDTVAYYVNPELAPDSLNDLQFRDPWAKLFFRSKESERPRFRNVCMFRESITNIIIANIVAADQRARC